MQIGQIGLFFLLQCRPKYFFTLAFVVICPQVVVLPCTYAINFTDAVSYAIKK